MLWVVVGVVILLFVGAYAASKSMWTFLEDEDDDD